jgi:SAM-dependent methyltransferase
MAGFLNKVYPFHQILIEKYHIKPVLREILAFSKGSLIDIGCGEKPFYKYIQHKVDRYVGLDHYDTQHEKKNIDVFASAYSIPFENSTFDVALMTQVIEHLEKPYDALTEINRILKEDGLLIVAWPFLYPVHEAPRDFHRLTGYGMEFLARETGFDIQKIAPSSGFWVMYYGLLSVYIFGKSKFIYLCLSPIMLVLFAVFMTCSLLDRNRTSTFKWTWNYYAVLKKKSKNAKR